MTDREWALLAPFLPPRQTTGRPRTTALREEMDAILYMGSTGCPWAMIPNDFPPPSTVQRYFYDWRDSGLWTNYSDSVIERAKQMVAQPPPTTDILAQLSCSRFFRRLDVSYRTDPNRSAKPTSPF